MTRALTGTMEGRILSAPLSQYPTNGISCATPYWDWPLPCLRRDNQGVNRRDTRRANLAAWIKKNYEGNVSAFARATELHQPRLAEILANTKPFGEKYARKVEEAAKMPAGHLDGLSGAGKAGMAAYHGIFLTRAGALLGAEW